MRSYGFHKKVYACVRELVEEGCDADEWIMRDACGKKILRNP